MLTSRLPAVSCVILFGSLLGPAALAGAPGGGGAGAAPELVVLNGTVRDFRKEHEDFDVDPIDGNGHCAGNVAPTLGADGRPVHAAGGFMVDTQWRNPTGRPIPPHLYRAGIGGLGILRLVEAPEIMPNATFDTWDSSVGPYGGDNVGPAPQVEVGATMPNLTEPQGIGSSTGDVTIHMGLLTGELHCDDLTITGHVVIGGQMTILCEDDFELQTNADLELLPGATLELYVKDHVRILPHANLNANTGDPGRVVIYVLGDGDMRLSQPDGVAYAAVVAPDAEMLVMPTADFYGTLVGRSLEVRPNGGFHLDTATTVPIDACGEVINDTAGSAALNSDGAIHSAETFAQWYRDILGVTLSAPYAITLQRDPMGVYAYESDSFYPVDGQLFGNEGDAHNDNFTYTIVANFEYEACADQFVEFQGLDDCWMFVDDALVMDLGGIEPETEQLAELDRLGLVDGEVYQLRIFFAHRHPMWPEFHLRTNLLLWNDSPVACASFPCD